MKLVDTREVVKALIPKYAKGLTLDVGGGTSKYRDIIDSYVDKYLVSDLYPLDGVDYVEDARKLGHKDKTFDTILSFQLLEHVDDTKAVVTEIYRVLKNGGIAIVTTPFLGAEHGHPSDFHRFTTEGLSWYFKEAGFKTLELGKQGSTLAVCAELLRFKFLNPYKKHGRIKTSIMTRIVKFLKKLDKSGILNNDSFYSNVYIVAQK